jgi:hypothetical protein
MVGHWKAQAGSLEWSRMVPVWAEARFDRKRRGIINEINRDDIMCCRDMTISVADRAVARCSWELKGGSYWMCMDRSSSAAL